MNTMHLFAGGGGGILADLILGHRPIIAVEWDKYACEVLRARVADGWFNGMSVWEGDVQLFDPSEYKGRVDCIHAGFPCQDISTAGNQAGVTEGTRSGLYREILRIADTVRPDYLFLENVSAIVTGNDGRWLRTVVGDLAARGYDAVWTCLSAAQVGAKHKRDRWWLLGYANSGQQPVSLDESINQRSPEITSERPESSSSTSSISNVSNSMCERGCSGNTEWKDAETVSELHRGEGRDTRRMGFWDVESNVGRVANGVANKTHRLRVLGNGQVPLQAATAFKLLWELKTQ
jgi:DNA (cytosine-5)-methyltransferase 1